MAKKGAVNNSHMKNRFKRTLVLYDGTCPFCTFSATRLRKLDWFHRLEIIDMYSGEILQNHQIPIEDAMQRIQVLNMKSHRKQGMEGILEISLHLPVLWVLVPFFWIINSVGLGNKIYDWIAKNRFLFPVPGYCPIPEEKTNGKS